MARGRKKPTVLKIITGNPGRRPLPKNELQVEPVMVPAPDFLGPDAKAEWDRVAPQLFALRMLSVFDAAALGAYCQVYAQWRQAVSELNAAGLLEVTSNGNKIQHPLVGIANTAARDMVRYAAEFGMTPSARARIDAGAAQTKDENSTDKYFA